MELEKELENRVRKKKSSIFLKICNLYICHKASELSRIDSYITRTQQYDVGDLMADLLDFAAKTLVLKGRLVYLLPTNEESVCAFCKFSSDRIA